MTLPYSEQISFFLAIVACFLAVGGSLVLLIVFFQRERSRPLLTQPIAKRAMAGSRIVAAVSGIFVSQFKIANEFLYVSVIISAIAYFLWEILGILADQWSKVDLTRLAVLERNVERFQSLMTTLGDFVATKRSAIAEVVRARMEDEKPKTYETKAAFIAVRETMDPDGQIKALLRILTSILVYDSGSASKPGRQTFRACLYVEENGYMIEKDSFDSIRQATAATRSSKSPEWRDRYRLDNRMNPSVIVKSVTSGKLIIVTDCEAEGICFTEEQATRLKSMISFPFTIGYDPKNLQNAALVVDTNVTGHFVEEDRGFLENCLVGCSSRIDLEIMYAELLRPHGEKTRQTFDSKEPMS